MVVLQKKVSHCVKILTAVGLTKKRNWLQNKGFAFWPVPITIDSRNDELLRSRKTALNAMGVQTRLV